jgi:hypothetical protein
VNFFKARLGDKFHHPLVSLKDELWESFLADGIPLVTGKEEGV